MEEEGTENNCTTTTPTETNLLMEHEDLFHIDHPIVVRDLKVLFNFSKNILFQRIKFVHVNEKFRHRGEIHKLYVKECVPLLNGIKIVSNPFEKQLYSNFIWTTGTTTSGKNEIKKGLTAKRSAISMSMYNKFQGKKFRYIHKQYSSCFS